MDSNSTVNISTKRISTLPIQTYSTEIKSELYPNPEQIVQPGKYSYDLYKRIGTINVLDLKIIIE